MGLEFVTEKLFLQVLSCADLVPCDAFKFEKQLLGKKFPPLSGFDNITVITYSPYNVIFKIWIKINFIQC